MSDIIEIQTTIDTREGALKIAQSLISNRIAACVQISGPITSIYRWKGNVEQTEEWVCTVKTRRDLYERVDQTIKEVHTYETPEILAKEIINGNEKYLLWIEQETE